MWHDILHIFLHALEHSALILPFLFVMHVLMEVFSTLSAAGKKPLKTLSGNFAPLIGAGTGLLPQCGFSVVATKLYSGRYITLGTLLAVYIATSDEAIPILIASPETALKLVPLLIIKFVLAVAVGYGVNFLFRRRFIKHADHEMTKAADCGCCKHEKKKCCHSHADSTADTNSGGAAAAAEPGQTAEPEQTADANVAPQASHDSGEIGSKKRFNAHRYILHPLIHTLKIFAYILAVNIILEAVMHFVGEEALFSALDQALWAQPFLAALIGLIPNCASSVVITEMYAIGALSLGAAVAGLSVNAGIAFAVLFKENKNLKENFAILGGLYVLSAVVGVIITAVSVAFF